MAAGSKDQIRLQEVSKMSAASGNLVGSFDQVVDSFVLDLSNAKRYVPDT